MSKHQLEIDNSQVPEGYKQTEIGVIPEDWEVIKLKNIAPLQRGFDLPTSQLKKGDYPVVYSNGVMNHHAEFMVHGPGVVTGRSGTIGSVHYVSKNYWPHNTTLWVTNFINSYPKYVYYLYQSVKFERFRTGSGVPTLNRNDVHDLIIAIPPSEEQRAIAQTLSDVDGLIAALDQVIAKKRNIKTATMQELLTGKKRLPGFGEEWQVKRLGDIANIMMGQSPSSQYYNSKEIGLPLIQGNADIKNRRAVIRNYTSEITKKCYDGDIILSVRAPVGEVAKTNFDACIGRGVSAHHLGRSGSLLIQSKRLLGRSKHFLSQSKIGGVVKTR